MDYLSNLLGKKKGSASPSRGGGSKSTHNTSSEATAPTESSFLQSRVDSTHTNQVTEMSGQDAPLTAGYEAAASMMSSAAAAPLANASPNTPTKKRLIAMMTDSSTKTVRVSVNNEEVVVTSMDLEEEKGGNENMETVLEGAEEGGMLAMMGDNGGELYTLSVCRDLYCFVQSYHYSHIQSISINTSTSQ